MLYSRLNFKLLLNIHRGIPESIKISVCDSIHGVVYQLLYEIYDLIDDISQRIAENLRGDTYLETLTLQ